MDMRGTRGLFFLLGVLAAAVIGLGAAPAGASPLDDAKSSGQLGEQWNGYLGVVKSNASDAIKALAAEINTKRRAHYANIAAKEGTKVDAVAAIAGAKLVESAPSGQYVRTSADADWTRVP